jgi:hypothetical protein
MKTRLQRWPGNSTLGFSVPMLALLLLLAAHPAGAATSFTATGWLNAVPLPGVLCTNGTGQVYLKGNAHVVRVQASDARTTGRLQAVMDLAYQADGTAIFSGPAHCEVGTWDPAGTTFTRTGGVWDMNYRGVAQADGSASYNMAGYGIGGGIEGLRVELTATRAAPGDPTIPYLISGTIKPAPVNIRTVLDNFDDNQFTWSWHGVGLPTATFFASETNQQLTMGGSWPSTSHKLGDLGAWADLDHPWAVSAGQTIELRVDLIALGQTAAGAGLALYHTSSQAYYLLVGRNYIEIAKAGGLGMAHLRVAQASIKDTNIVLSLALTPVGGNVVVTGKVLDKNDGAVIAQVVATDTPASDPTLSASEVAQLTGGRTWLDTAPDPSGAPYTSGIAPLIVVFQDSDVAPLTAMATFDNFELLTYEVPPVGIQRAVQLTWPDTGMNFAVEAAPTVQGPWLPANDQLPPGVQQMTFPANGSKMFWRLIQAP